MSETTEPQIVYAPFKSRLKPLILTADDDPSILHILSVFFDKKDCDLIQVQDGAQAIERIIIDKPDLVILDVMMPEFSGWEVSKYIKERDDLDEMGVIIVTAIGPNNNQITSPLFGADDFLDKPFELDELEEKVTRVLETKGQKLGLKTI